MLRGRNWLVDGGLGFALEEFGFGIHRDPLWSARLLASNPNAIKEVHKAYLEAGAEIIITSSYQASIQGFCSHLEVDEKKAMEHMELSVQLAKDAVKEYAEFGCGEGLNEFFIGGKLAIQSCIICYPQHINFDCCLFIIALIVLFNIFSDCKNTSRHLVLDQHEKPPLIIL